LQRLPPEAARRWRTPLLLCNVGANCEPPACRYGFHERFRLSRAELMQTPCLHPKFEMQTPAASCFCSFARIHTRCNATRPPLLHPDFNDIRPAYAKGSFQLVLPGHQPGHLTTGSLPSANSRCPAGARLLRPLRTSHILRKGFCGGSPEPSGRRTRPRTTVGTDPARSEPSLQPFLPACQPHAAPRSITHRHALTLVRPVRGHLRSLHEY